MSAAQQATRPGGFMRRAFREFTYRFGYDERSPELGDFTTSSRILIVSLFAMLVGLVASFLAVGLLKLIALFTNLFFFQRLSLADRSIADAHLGLWVLVVPVVGGLMIGVMARYGSDRIRGHGIPEAIEAILLNGSRVQPRVAFLKPLSSAISIGSGGPFGAEGPIIMTGGAFGSLMAQFFHFTSAERKTLLVAGAAAGMAATFGTPIAAVLLAVELLLFEWKPRSLVPVALASAVATLMRHYLIGAPPLFPVLPHNDFVGPVGLLGAAFVGLSAGGLSMALTAAVYAAEDGFHRLPIHWMWWPAIGGLAIGVGGLIFPPALGVGYETIGQLLLGEDTSRLILGVLLVKSAIWVIALGSGTSGGVLAPLLMMGGALGALEGNFLPAEGEGFWALIAMGAILGGTMRSPFTGIIFTFELTHDVNALLPLVVAVTIAHASTVLWLRRSILTEKISRRGFHVGREYAIDPLELVFVREVMRTNIAALPSDLRLGDLAATVADAHAHGGQHVYPVLDAAGRLSGVVSRTYLRLLIAEGSPEGEERRLGDLIQGETVVAYPHEPLRLTVLRMAESGYTRMPVVDPAQPRTLMGLVSLEDVLFARGRVLDEERQRDRPLRVRVFWPRARSRSAAAP